MKFFEKFPKRIKAHVRLFETTEYITLVFYFYHKITNFHLIIFKDLTLFINVVLHVNIFSPISRCDWRVDLYVQILKL